MVEIAATGMMTYDLIVTHTVSWALEVSPIAALLPPVAFLLRMFVLALYGAPTESTRMCQIVVRSLMITRTILVCNTWSDMLQIRSLEYPLVSGAVVGHCYNRIALPDM